MNWQRAGTTTDAAPLARMSMGSASGSTTALTSGLDVSGYTTKPSSQTWDQYWTTWISEGYKFAFIKATEGTYYSPSSSGAKFNAQWKGATNAGMMRGAYHFANPSDSSAVAQADFFINNGGGWTADGKTLPGVLDIEYNPYSGSNHLNTCYGLSNAKMVAWIRAFSNEYKLKEKVYPIIYSTVGWWSMCTGNSSAFSKTSAFWLADPNTGSTTGGPGSLTAGTTTWVFWQYGQASQVDLNRFNGAYAELQNYATNTFPVGSHFPAGSADALGAPIGPEIKATAFGATGYYQSFASGVGLITSPYGTFTTSGAIYSSWSPWKWGWPTGALQSAPAGSSTGYYQDFTEGSVPAAVYWTPTYGLGWVDGNLLSQYKALGGPTWGWPTSSMNKQTAFGISGASLSVQNGRSIVVSSVATVVNKGEDHGAIFASWSPSRRGWPTSPPQPVTANGGGFEQDYTEGPPGASGTVPAQAYSTSKYGVSWADGEVLTRYQQLGGPAGTWGWPTNSDKPTAFGIQGAYLSTPGGRAIISSKYGTFTDAGGDRGAIFASWSPARNGWPTTNLVGVRARGISGYQQRFIAGAASQRAFWSSLRPTATWLSGAILKRYDALGGTSSVGWPTAAMTTQVAFAVRGWIQRFQTRALIASRYGTYSSNGAIFAAWRPTLRGWPTADLKTRVLRGKAGWIQTFRKGAKVDYAFMARGSRTVMWFNGAPPK